MTGGDFGPEMPEDCLDGPLPLAQVAAYSGVPPERIRQWKARGRIAPSGLDEFGRPMYLLVDVWRAEDADCRGKQGRRLATRRASPHP